MDKVTGPLRPGEGSPPVQGFKEDLGHSDTMIQGMAKKSILGLTVELGSLVAYGVLPTTARLVV
ncbi:hypothetical protein EYZ11_006763 [Aspergillus tanneri]|uniref:Uncharacterized protein n=1 Tax=Aspergillus tanneri TaxID=1220188 RepID=A0A4S3JF57_9EURO|nr:hypothetical protein EYZ11_006763 [Aspergillus tanneri]